MIIQLIVLDIDGTLTDGSIVYGDNGFEIKTFSVRDGLALKILPQLGISVLLLTGRHSEAAKRRATELGCDIIENIPDKRTVLESLLLERNIMFENTVYIGDDLNDYAAMSLCGFKACPTNASKEIKEICDYISPYNGGYGAVRDIVEYILKKQEQWDKVLKIFTQNGSYE
jgi:3-deoxy-D-manno-octulosonate 8-phosphate phosphatase (KDO 8-P phosphatase)